MEYRRILLVGVAAALAAGALTGCSGDDKPAATGPSATMIVPGKPGEPNRTVVAGPTSPKPPNAADIQFIQHMIPHHEQALEMSALAKDQAESTKIKTLAQRIDAAQSSEIAAMQSWLKQHKVARTGQHGGHGGHNATGTMPGMLTTQQMSQLKAARGKEFDRLFLTLMIKHHEGALKMANEALEKGSGEVTVLQMARSVIGDQTAEIRRMRILLAE